MTNEEIDWYELACPLCGQDCFDGQGRDSEGRYRHRCSDCETVVCTPERINGKIVGTK